MKETNHKISSNESMDRIIIPMKYFPTSRFGKIILTIKDNKIVNCETTTTHKIEKQS